MFNSQFIADIFSNSLHILLHEYWFFWRWWSWQGFLNSLSCTPRSNWNDDTEGLKVKCYHRVTVYWCRYDECDIRNEGIGHSDWPHADTLLMWLQLCNRVSDSGEAVSHCGVSGRDTTAQDAADFRLNFRAASCCFIRERLSSTSVAFMTSISRGVTAESETRYRGITALFSWFVPISAVITAVTTTLPRLRSPCHPLIRIHTIELY